ncbi:MAG: phosphodiester glycosidase family protein [Verrucomicrobiales bacterium]|nr:phosphodiester glycosidase family protein [Verrucomicrobiales bacterium]
MHIFLKIIPILVLSNAASSAIEPKPESSTHISEQGIQYSLKKSTDPIPNRIHVLRIDLASKKIKPKVALGPDPDGEGPAEVALTDPRKLASDPSVLAFVNTNPWDSFPNDKGKKNRNWYPGQPVDIHGLAGTQGKMRSTTAPGNTSVWFDAQSGVHFGHKPEDKPEEATTGFQLIVSKGKLTVGEGGPRHPRTSIGTDEKGEILWLVVVDGRQKGYSEGMNMHELATVMKDLGCWSATNMDGGGSSVMGLLDEDGKMKIMNSPSDRFLGIVRIRPLPMILTIQKNKNKN